jgi:hypothetical protein
MASPLKCPSPTCPFQFDPSQVPAGAVISCPRCGLRFTLGPTAPGIPTDPFENAASESLPVSRPTRKAKANSGSLKGILVTAAAIFGVLLIVLGIGWLAITLSKNKGNSTAETETEIKYPDLNLVFKKPTSDSGWTKHDSTRLNFNAALFGYVKGGDEHAPIASIVGDARTFSYAVRPTDLRERVTQLLNKEFDNVTESEEAREETLCGQPATRLLYRATTKKAGDAVLLEVHTLASKTLAVWVFAWAAEREFAGYASAFQSVRSGLQIVKTNAPSLEVSTFTKTHRSKSGIFTIQDSDGLWAVKEPASSLDLAGTLWLRGTPKSASGKKPSPVDLVVVEVEPKGDPNQQALEVVKQSLPVGESTIEEWTGEPTGDAATGEVKPNTPVIRLKVKYKGAENSVNKLVVFSTVESQGKLIVAYTSCQWKDQGYWEQRLMQIVGSLAPRQK